MEKFVSLLLKNEEEAFKASQEIVQLAKQDEIQINELFIITREDSGNVKILDVKSGKVPYTASAGMIGGLLGIMGGPLGVFFGMTTGLIAGSIGDLVRVSKSQKFIDKAGYSIPIGQTAILGNIVETWEVPLNSTLKKYDASIQRMSVNDTLAKLAEEEEHHLKNQIQTVESKIELASEEEKGHLQNKLSQLQQNYSLVTSESTNDSTENKFSHWIEKVKINLVKFKDNVSDYFDDEKDEVLDEYHEVRKEYIELNFKIKSALKRLKTADETNFKASLNYLKEEIREFDEEIEELRIEILKLSGADRVRWDEKFTTLLSKRNDLLNQTKANIESFSKNNENWSKEMINAIK